MIRTFNGKLIAMDKKKFKNDYDYYRFLWKKKYNIKINKKQNNEECIKNMVK